MDGVKSIPYPKTDNLWHRDPDTHLIEVGRFNENRPDFQAVNQWHVTEKINGTNIRIVITDKATVLGRSDKADLPKGLADSIFDMLPTDPPIVLMHSHGFDPNFDMMTLYGEGYGPGIQKGGGNYADVKSFRLFDVRVNNTWLEWDDVEDVAEALNLMVVPVLASGVNLNTLIGLVTRNSEVARWHTGAGIQQEGIVARSMPLLFNARGQQVKFKLKNIDLDKANA